MNNPIRNFFILTFVAFVGVGIIFQLFSIFFRPEMAEKADLTSPERLAIVEKFRQADAKDQPEQIYVEVDYSEGKNASWYPKYESPILTRLVQEGKLPPLEERVPSEPVVLDGVHGPQQYGGTLIRMDRSPRGVYQYSNRLGYAQLVRYSPNTDPIVPHVAKEFEVSDDLKTFTFTLRKGMKWSDGHPYTVDDIEYRWHHELNDPSVGLLAYFFRHKGKIPKFEKLGPYKFRWVFEDPYGKFINALACAYGRAICNSPKHYLKQFHPKLGDQKLIEELMTKMGIGSKKALYKRMTMPDNTDKPKITPWMYNQVKRTPPLDIVRNPYYFAVDSKGQQLPYLDRVSIGSTAPMMLNNALASGEVDFEVTEYIDEYTLLMSRAEEKGYEVHHWNPLARTYRPIVIDEGFRPKNESEQKLKDLYDNIKFRKALSISINREEIAQAVFQNIVRPSGTAPPKSSPMYKPKHSAAGTTYDPKKANELLDEIGLINYDNEGFRTFSDGSKLVMYFDFPKVYYPAYQFVIDQWNALKLRVIPRLKGEQLFLQELATGRTLLHHWTNVDIPMARLSLGWNYSASRWYEAGGLFGSEESKEFIAPIPGSKTDEYIRLYDQLVSARNGKENDEIFDKMLDIINGEYRIINLMSPFPTLAIVKKEVRNIPKSLNYGWMNQCIGAAGPETIAFSKEHLAKPEIIAYNKSVEDAIADMIINPIQAPELNVSSDIALAKSQNKEVQKEESNALGTVIKWTFILIFGILFVMVVSRHPYVVNRLVIMIPTLAIISLIVFFVIELPPGSYIESRIAALEESGEEIDPREIAHLRETYALDKPFFVKYVRWLGLSWFTSFEEKDKGLLQGYMGRSMENDRSVNEIVGDRVLMTFLISLGTLLFTWFLAIPIGIYSAVRQYSWGDYFFTLFGFIGMCIPGFLLSLLMMYFSDVFFGFMPTGLFSSKYATQPHWDFAKFLDLLKHIWVPILVMGIGGTASMIRVMRANLLDELKKPYVTTARAKGVKPLKLLFKYPFRLAINPFISGVGGIFPSLVAGGSIVAIILSLPTVGPLLLSSLMSQDLYMAGSLLMMFSLLGIFGTLVSDLLLLVVDPRIRFQGGNK